MSQPSSLPMLVMLASLITLPGKSTPLSPCAGREGWWSCGEGEDCISSAQVCDGQPDCDRGGDESDNTCTSWRCEHGVRCRDSHVCVATPHQAMCSGGRSVCPDSSDQDYCQHKMYSGCFVNTTLGLRIAGCDSCVCDSRDTADTGQRTAAVFKSSSSSFRSSNITGRICIERSSRQVCDGVEDCVLGEDEDPALCNTKDGTVTSETGRNRNERRGRKVVPRQFSVDSLLHTEEIIQSQDTISMKMILVIFLATLVIAVGLCLLIIFVMFRTRSKSKTRRKSIPKMERQTSGGSENTYVMQANSPTSCRKVDWSLKTCTIVKELGKGFFSKVYLAKDTNNGFVAMKTVDNPTEMYAEECIRNEIEIFSKLGAHSNIVKLIGFNKAERLLVLEYCTPGNLKEYVLKFKNGYSNELSSETKELDGDKILTTHSSLTKKAPKEIIKNPTSDQDKMNGGDENSHVLNTGRLLNWSYQVSKGMKYLSDLGIIHRDVALRNVLLTNNNVVKIADFGLAVSLPAENKSKEPEKPSQYWSRNIKPTPFKWMAIESLTSNVFSRKSDVWAFAVTLWELFSLGEEPYGNMNPADLQKMLQEGGRLGECVLATGRVNQLIKDCWRKNPSERPSFEEAKELLSNYTRQEDNMMDSLCSILDCGERVVDGYLDMSCVQTLPRTSYWTNYKMVHGPAHQILD